MVEGQGVGWTKDAFLCVTCCPGTLELLSLISVPKLVYTGANGSFSHSGFQASELWPCSYFWAPLGSSGSIWIFPEIVSVTQGEIGCVSGLPHLTVLALLPPGHGRTPACLPPSWGLFPCSQAQVFSALRSSTSSGISLRSSQGTWWGRSVAGHRAVS